MRSTGTVKLDEIFEFSHLSYNRFNSAVPGLPNVFYIPGISELLWTVNYRYYLEPTFQLVEAHEISKSWNLPYVNLSHLTQPN